MADVLTGGPAPGPGRPRRRVVVAGTVLLAGVAAVLAGRSTQGRPDAAPTPTPVLSFPVSASVPAPAPTRVGTPGVVSVAVGRRYAYALTEECNAQAVRACAYRLYRRAVDGSAWTLLPPRAETRSTTGVFPAVLVSGDDVVTVLEGGAGRLYSSVDGQEFGYHDLAAGPAIDALPADGLVWPGQAGPVTVLEPATGRLRPLRTQPQLGDGIVRVAQQRGRVLWTAATGRTGPVSAVSVDRGRTWRAAPVPAARDVADLQLVVGPGGSAYLLGIGRTDRLAAVWRTDGPGRVWTRLAGPLPRGVRSALAADRGLLVADQGGTVWRLGPEGAFAPLPDPGPTRPAQLAAGGGRLLAATPRGGIPDLLVLTSPDGGESWRTERL